VGRNTKKKELIIFGEAIECLHALRVTALSRGEWLPATGKSNVAWESRPCFTGKMPVPLLPYGQVDLPEEKAQVRLAHSKDDSFGYRREEEKLAY
jgi:hypothetical protein